jgi:hypothetical protein
MFLVPSSLSCLKSYLNSSNVYIKNVACDIIEKMDLLSSVLLNSNFPWSCQPNNKTCKERKDYQSDKARDIASYSIIEETSEPCTQCPSYSIENKKRSKDTPIGLPCKKISCNKWRQSSCGGISHSEKEGIGVRQEKTGRYIVDDKKAYP